MIPHFNVRSGCYLQRPKVDGCTLRSMKAFPPGQGRIVPRRVLMITVIVASLPTWGGAFQPHVFPRQETVDTTFPIQCSLAKPWNSHSHCLAVGRVLQHTLLSSLAYKCPTSLFERQKGGGYLLRRYGRIGRLDDVLIGWS